MPLKLVANRQQIRRRRRKKKENKKKTKKKSHRKTKGVKLTSSKLIFVEVRDNTCTLLLKSTITFVNFSLFRISPLYRYRQSVSSQHRHLTLSVFVLFIYLIITLFERYSALRTLIYLRKYTGVTSIAFHP